MPNIKKYSDKNDNNPREDKSEKDDFLPLSHWLRREILLILNNEDKTFTDLLENINKNKEEKISKSRLHQHLEILVNGKYLRRFRETGHTWYVLNPDKLEEVSKYVESFLKQI